MSKDCNPNPNGDPAWDGRVKEKSQVPLLDKSWDVELREIPNPD